MKDIKKKDIQSLRSNKGGKSYVLLSMFCVGGIGSIICIFSNNVYFISIGFGLGAIIGFVITGLMNKRK